MLTGPEGQFEFSGLPAGNAYVTVTKPGFSPEGMEGGRMPSVTVEVGAKTGKVELKLVPECVIAGQITGKDEEPLEGASIDALAVRIQGGRKQLVPVRRGVTSDEDGNFRLAGLAPGRYYLRARTANVSRRILGALSENGSQAYPPVVYYPTSNELESATPLDLTGSQRAQVLLSLKLAQAFKITGTIAAAGSWKQLQRPMLVDETGQMLFASDKLDSESGAFEFAMVPAGTYHIRIVAQNEQSHSSWTQQTIHVEADVTGLRLALPASTAIKVTVRAEFADKGPAGSCTTLNSAMVKQTSIPSQ
jgi:hypothetical protein